MPQVPHLQGAEQGKDAICFRTKGGNDYCVVYTVESYSKGRGKFVVVGAETERRKGNKDDKGN